MKTIIVAILAATSLCAAAPTEYLDAKFMALQIWAAQITAAEEGYNTRCEKNLDGEGCAEVRQILDEQVKYFIECANRYSTEGDDCRAQLRPLIVGQQIRIFKWNLDCFGQPLAPDQITQCGTEKDAVIKQAQELQIKVNACTKSLDKKL